MTENQHQSSLFLTLRRAERTALQAVDADRKRDLFRPYSPSSQLCQTFWTSSLSSNISRSLRMFLISSSLVRVM